MYGEAKSLPNEKSHRFSSLPIPYQILTSSVHEICHSSISTQNTGGFRSSTDKQVWMLRRAGGCTAGTCVFPISNHVSKTQRVPLKRKKPLQLRLVIR